jgi:ABC-type oligopeptide transport system ATPase subunit
MIKLESVTKTYTLGQQRIVAVNDVSLTIEPGEFVAVMGKSGCGKTTLLGLIGGLDRPDRGHIWVEGEDITQLPDLKLTRYRRDQVGIRSRGDQKGRFRLESKSCWRTWISGRGAITIPTKFPAVRCKELP